MSPKKATGSKTKKKAAAKKPSTAKKKVVAGKAAAKKAPVKKKAAAKKVLAKSAKPSKATSKSTKSTSKSTDKSTTKAKAKTTATKSTPKSKFDQKFLDEQRELLLEERAKYEKSSITLKAEADSLVEGREPGDVQFDEESGDGDSLAVERDRGLHMSATARQQVEEIDAALLQLDDGSYGICKISGKPIPKERLRAIPWATERVEEKVGGFRR